MSLFRNNHNKRQGKKSCFQNRRDLVPSEKGIECHEGSGVEKTSWIEKEVDSGKGREQQRGPSHQKKKKKRNKNNRVKTQNNMISA